MILAGDAGIAAAHARCFGAPAVTDVISQAYRPLSPSDGWRGDIVVNVRRAAAIGGSHGADDELALYIAHGCDHLCGARDDTPRRRAAMLRRERAWLAAFRRRAGPLRLGLSLTPP